MAYNDILEVGSGDYRFGKDFRFGRSCRRRRYCRRGWEPVWVIIASVGVWHVNDYCTISIYIRESYVRRRDNILRRVAAICIQPFSLWVNCVMISVVISGESHGNSHIWGAPCLLSYLGSPMSIVISGESHVYSHIWGAPCLLSYLGSPMSDHVYCNKISKFPAKWIDSFQQNTQLLFNMRLCILSNPHLK